MKFGQNSSNHRHIFLYKKPASLFFHIESNAFKGQVRNFQSYAWPKLAFNDAIFPNELFGKINSNKFLLSKNAYVSRKKIRRKFSTSVSLFFFMRFFFDTFYAEVCLKFLHGRQFFRPSTTIIQEQRGRHKKKRVKRVKRWINFRRNLVF